MLKKFLTLFCFGIMLTSITVQAAYTVAYCKNAAGQILTQYVCFVNPWWATPEWVKPGDDPYGASTPSNICEHDTGKVFNSTDTILNDCLKFPGGANLHYVDY